MSLFSNIWTSAYDLKNKIVGKSLKNTLEELTADNDENFNVPHRVLQDLATRTFNESEYEIIIQHIWAQFTGISRPWRKMLKTLILIDYLIKNGAPRFVDDIREEIYHIRLLTNFSQLENGEDKGVVIREKTVNLDKLINDDSLIDQERRKADAARKHLKNLGAFDPTTAKPNPAITNATNNSKKYQGISSEDMGHLGTDSAQGEGFEQAEKGVLSKGADKKNKGNNDSDYGLDISGDDIKHIEMNDFDDDHDDQKIVKSDQVNFLDQTKTKKEPTLKDKEALPKPLIDLSRPVLQDISNSVQNQSEQHTWAWDQTIFDKVNSLNNNNTENTNTKTKTEAKDEFNWGFAPAADAAKSEAFETFFKRSESAPVETEPIDKQSSLASHASEAPKSSAKEFYTDKERAAFDFSDWNRFAAEEAKRKNDENTLSVASREELDRIYHEMKQNPRQTIESTRQASSYDYNMGQMNMAQFSKNALSSNS